jgi:hypothetical protein
MLAGKFFVYCKISTQNLKHVKNKKLFVYPIFILYHALLYTNLHTKFQKNPSMFPECRPNTNLLRFHASWNVKIF